MERDRAPQMVLEGGGEEPDILLGAIDRCIDEMAPGQVLQVASSEPAATVAIVDWCRAAGHALTDLFPSQGSTLFWIRKGG